MNCTLCRWAMRWLAREDPIYFEEGENFWAEVRGRVNTNAIFSAEADPDRLRQLAKLAETAPEESFAEFLALAEAGSVWSMIRVAASYALGKDAPCDLREAERWYARARDGGSDEGLLRSAELARKRGDQPTARALLTAGADRGLTQALNYLVAMELKAGRRAEARASLERAASRGHFAAEAELAKAMARGSLGWAQIPNGIVRVFRTIQRAVAEIENRKIRREASLQ